VRIKRVVRIGAKYYTSIHPSIHPAGIRSSGLPGLPAASIHIYIHPSGIRFVLGLPACLLPSACLPSAFCLPSACLFGWIGQANSGEFGRDPTGHTRPEASR